MFNNDKTLLLHTAIGFKFWKTPMHHAAEGNAVDVIEILREHGADIDPRDIERKTPLQIAIINGSDEFAVQMINFGADVNWETYEQFTPLHFAAQYGRETVLDALLSNGADVNRETANSVTPLHLAVISRHFSIVMKLVTAGANLETKGLSQDGSSRTALRLAADMGDDEIVEFLLSKGARKEELSEEIHSQYFAIEL